MPRPLVDLAVCWSACPQCAHLAVNGHQIHSSTWIADALIVLCGSAKAQGLYVCCMPYIPLLGKVAIGCRPIMALQAPMQFC